MLQDFLKANRDDLIARCKSKAEKRNEGPLPQSEHGIPRFIDQLIETLRQEQMPDALARHKLAGPGRPSLALVPSDIAGSAEKHGEELRRQGVTFDQVVHDYGDLCQALTELAMEKNATISVDEFHTFNRCSDDAIADAVTSFARDMLAPVAKPNPAPGNDRGAAHAEQMRILLDRALVSFAIIKEGGVGTRSATAILHEQSLIALRDLIDGADLHDFYPRVAPR